MAKIQLEDVALAAGYFGLFWLLSELNMTSSGDLPVPSFAAAWPVIAVAGCTGVLLRRVRPAAMAWLCALAVVGLALAGHAGAFVLAFEFFFSLVLFASPRASQLAARSAWVLTVMLVVAAFAVSRSAADTVAAAIVAVVSLLTPVEWAGNLRKANLLADSESARADAVQDAARQRLLAERSTHDLALEHERHHLARELHDVISARLSAIALQSGAALQGGAAPSTTLLGQIRAESVAGLDELNTMIRLLHTGAALEAAGELGDLQELVVQRRGAGQQLRLENSLPDGGERLPLPVRTAVYRIAAEALVNAAKHAPGSPVDIMLGLAGPDGVQEVHLTVTNTLPGFPVAKPDGTGTGIPSMHFRAAHAGGCVAAGPAGELWKVLLRLPVHEGQQK